jgi:hypothetical protein
MTTPYVNAMSFWERMGERWNRVEAVLASSSLGMRDQLEAMTGIIGCDCVLLASSLRSSERMGSDEWEWKVHRALPTKYAGLVTDNTHLQAMGLGQLAKTLGDVAKKAQGAQMESPPLTNEQRLYLFNDWGCQSKKSRARCAQMPGLWDHGFKLPRKGKPPIKVSIGGTKYLVTHMGLVLLGSVSIGRWELGESYLVFLDLEEDQVTSPAPKQWVSTVREDCFPFLAYLGEINAHFNRLLHLNQLHPVERLQRIEEMTDIERDAYCRSATRLTPLLSKDLPAAIETLVQMKAFCAHKATSPPGGADEAARALAVQEAEAAKQTIKAAKQTIKAAEAALAGFAQRSYPVLEDSCKTVSGDEKARRSAHVLRQVEWTGIWWALEELHHYSQRRRDDAYRKWSSKLPAVLRQMKYILAHSPAEAWFHVGVGKDGSLMLSGPCLAGFLVAQVVAHCSNRIDPDQLSLSDFSDPRGLEVLTFARKLVCAIRYALGCLPPDEDVLRALLWLLSEIGHTRFSVDRRLDFERHLYLAAMEQPALYGLKPFYRDHLNHVIQVCLTGWLLLETETKDANGQKRKVADVFQMPDQGYDNLLGQWFVASLLHDVGYVIDIGAGWAELLERFEDPVMGDLSRRTREMMKEWTAHADKWSEWGYQIEDRPGEDHGVVSALHVQSAIADIASPSVADYGAALTAIAHHNHPNATIHFQEERLSVLLVLCDELQEWDRPWLGLERAALALSTIVVFSPVHAPRWHEPLSKVTTNLRLTSASGDTSEAMITVNGSVLDFWIKYSADIHRSHSVFNAWLGRSRNLQRITLGDTGECPLDFRYRMESPVAPPSALTARDRSEPELTRLWRIVRDQRIWSIHRWLEAASNGKKPPSVGTGLAEQAVMYEIDDDGKAEIVMLDVRQLASASLISGDLTKFQKTIALWRYAGESMDESS